MKKVMVLLAVAVLAVAFFGTTACKKAALADPTPTPTLFALLDDFVDGDNRTDTTVFGGYWYTFDDLAASNDNVTCGNSQIVPMSANAGIKFYGITTQTPVPAFVMKSYTVTSETQPTGVTSGYYARVSGTVDRSGYPYGFAGFGCNLLDVNADGSKQVINFITAGYTRLTFWYKNGPAMASTDTVPWKVKLPTSYAFPTGGCKMEEVDDQPVCAFTATNVWQKFDKNLINDFANEGWGTAACGSRTAPTTCVTGAISYIAGAATSQFKCTSSQALTALNALQWQTNFPGTNALPGNKFDLEIAQVALIK